MDRNFLESLGLEDGVIGPILEEHGRDVQREALRAETAENSLRESRETLARLEYDGIVQSAVEGLGLKFSSKAAQRDFFAQLQAERLTVENGALVGLEEFVQARREADPAAFAPDRPVPRFVAPAGLGCAQAQALPANVAQARAMGAERAAARRASGEVMKNFL
ncbi:MAG: hypothetical protein HFF73_02960 [Oscillospiraceae bacterium]|nr:hypothetical protein [Oscillospiraceae bacterium]